MTEPTDDEIAALRAEFGITSNGRGIPFVGIEIDPVHYRTAVERLQAELMLENVLRKQRP